MKGFSNPDREEAHMADLPAYPDTADDIDGEVPPDRGLKWRVPRWVYAFGIIGIVLVKLLIILAVGGAIAGGLH